MKMDKSLPQNDSKISFGILNTLLGYHLRRAQASVFDDFMNVMADNQITPGQFGVLTLIDANPGLNQSTLAKTIGIGRSTMVAVIDGLEKRQLVERRKSPEDKRSYALTMTPKGNALMKEVNPKVQNHEQKIVAGLSDEEVKTLSNLLSRMYR